MKNSAVCLLILLVSSQFVFGQTIYTGFDYNFTSTVTGAQNCFIDCCSNNYGGIIRNVGDGTGVNDISKGIDNSFQIRSNATVTTINIGSQRSNGYGQSPVVLDMYRSRGKGFSQTCSKLDDSSTLTGGFLDMSKFKKVRITAKASSPMRLRFELGKAYSSSTGPNSNIFEMNLTTTYQDFYFDYNGKYEYFDSTKISTIRLKFNVGPFDDPNTGFTGTVNISRFMLGDIVESIKNPSDSLPYISGKAFYDLNNNQVMDSSDRPAAYKKVSFQPSNKYTFTNGDGNYYYYADSIGSIQASMDSLPYFFKPSTVSLSGLGFNSISTANFVYKKSQDIKEIAISSIIGQFAARPGFYLVNNIQIENKGTVSVPTTLKFDFPSTYTPYGFGNMTCNTITSTCTYNLGTLKPGVVTIIPIDGVLSPSARLGDTLKFNYQVNPNDALDIDSLNNKAGITYVVRGSYDPNDKAATPYLDPQKAALSQWIDYTIRFQNTGTDTAFTVVVVDTLPDKLIASSLAMISTSHKCTFNQKDRITTFKFSNILLPDSNINEKKSHGYIKFRVKTKTGLTSSETIRNMASIYFDFNSPVLTNYAETSFLQARVTATQSDNFHKENETFVYSNPVEGDRFYIKSEKQEEAKLYNFSGICVFSGTVGKEGVFVGNLPKGIYLFLIGNHREKVILK